MTTFVFELKERESVNNNGGVNHSKFFVRDNDIFLRCVRLFSVIYPSIIMRSIAFSSLSCNEKVSIISRSFVITFHKEWQIEKNVELCLYLVIERSLTFLSCNWKNEKFWLMASLMVTLHKEREIEKVNSFVVTSHNQKVVKRGIVVMTSCVQCRPQASFLVTKTR